MFDLGYAAIILFGAVTLIVEASRQFAKPSSPASNDKYPILQNVELSSLSTRPEFLRGYIMYVAVFLFIYAAFLLSTELYALIERFGQNAPRGEVGASGVFSPEVGGEVVGKDIAYGKPLIISSAIILALSFEVFSNVEAWLRGLAHRLAGIPRGVYRIITRLNQFDYAAFGDKRGLKLAAQLDAFLTAHNISLDDDATARETRLALRTVDLLAPAVVGQYRDRLWPQQHQGPFNELVQQEAGKVNALEHELKALTNDADALHALHYKAVDERNNIQALFALFFIRHRDVAIPDIYPPVTYIIRQLRQDKTNTYLNSLAGACLVPTLLTIFLFCAVYILFRSYFNPDAHLTAAFIGEQFGVAIEDALIFVSKFVALIAISAGFAISVRESRLETEKWPSWRWRSFPFMRFLTSALGPALLAAAAFTLLSFVEYVLRIYISFGTLLSETQMYEFYTVHFTYSIAMFVPAMVVCWFTFIICDAHSRMTARQSLLTAVGCSALFAVNATLMVILTYDYSMAYSDDVIMKYLEEFLYYLIIPLTFFTGFAALVEISERRA